MTSAAHGTCPRASPGRRQQNELHRIAALRGAAGCPGPPQGPRVGKRGAAASRHRWQEKREPQAVGARRRAGGGRVQVLAVGAVGHGGCPQKVALTEGWSGSPWGPASLLRRPVPGTCSPTADGCPHLTPPARPSRPVSRIGRGGDSWPIRDERGEGSEPKVGTEPQAPGRQSSAWLYRPQG